MGSMYIDGVEDKSFVVFFALIMHLRTCMRKQNQYFELTFQVIVVALIRSFDATICIVGFAKCRRWMCELIG